MHHWIRHNILGLIAIFIALSGSATAVHVASKRQSPSVKAPVAEVAKKSKVRRGPRGPQGPPGPQGAPGIQGEPGPVSLPTVGFGTSNAGTPSGSPTYPDIRSATFNLAVSSRVMVESLGVFTWGCPGACTVDYGLYVDGEPVPNTQHTGGSGYGSSAQMNGAALTGTLAAGPHTLSVGMTDVAGDSPDFAGSLVALPVAN